MVMKMGKLQVKLENVSKIPVQPPTNKEKENQNAIIWRRDAEFQMCEETLTAGSLCTEKLQQKLTILKPLKKNNHYPVNELPFGLQSCFI